MRHYNSDLTIVGQRLPEYGRGQRESTADVHVGQIEGQGRSDEELEAGTSAEEGTDEGEAVGALWAYNAC